MRRSLGLPSTRALGELGARNDSAPLDRLCQTLITAIERGSPLARVLHDQARDIREASRQRLLEEGGKREIAMLLPRTIAKTYCWPNRLRGL